MLFRKNKKRISLFFYYYYLGINQKIETFFRYIAVRILNNKMATITKRYDGTVCADLKKKLIEIFNESVLFKLQAHKDKNWTIWNMFIDCGKSTICIIDTEHSPFIVTDTDEEILKLIALKKLMEEYELGMYRFYDDDKVMFNKRYVCLKYID